MSESKDVKPDSGTINVKVKDSDTNTTVFKVKPTTKFDKVFQAYANRKGVQVSSLRFMFDGERLNGAQTPQDVELQNDDQIDVYIEQTGGRC
mmetsp:Transcript_19891/g.56196  ORF Transcript_19891/g.56196 Transcript_19891/m.56196 type:complete len:92 (-) Transcript_19891:99-374(-)